MRSRPLALTAALVAVAVLPSCSGGGDGEAAQTVHPYPTIEGGYVLGSDVDPGLQEALRTSIDATAARDPDAYWEIIVDACKQYHGSVDDFARYFVSEQGSIDGMLRLSGAPYRVSDMQLDLDQTWVTFDDPDHAWVKYGAVHAVEGTLLVPTADAEPVRWIREAAAWRTTFCTFSGEQPVDDQGRLVGVSPTSVSAPGTTSG